MLRGRRAADREDADLRAELDRLREENERLTAAVTQLKRQRGRLRERLDRLKGAVGTDPERDLGYVFVVTYGRSGSTLIAGILNTLPGYLIRGENRDAVGFLYDFHRVCTAERERVPPGKSIQRTHPFFGISHFPDARSIAGIRRLVVETLLRPDPDTRVTGFKEIRWNRADLSAYVAWLREVFPGARFVVNTRHLTDVSRSAWWAKNPDSLAELEESERRILALAEELGDAAYHVHYDDYVADPTVLRGLVEWLGETWDEQTVRATLERTYSV